MNRIAIIGSPGAGKSTFARKLGHITGIPVYHLDTLYWKPGWVEPDRDAWIQAQQHVIRHDTWIIDGNYGATMDMRLGAADTVIWLDLPRRICLYQVLKRYLLNRGRTRSDMGVDCPEKLDAEFLRYVWNFSRDQRPGILQRLSEMEKSASIVTLRSHAEIRHYLQKMGRQYQDSS
jgi:adenylate kinase family enzyme